MRKRIHEILGASSGHDALSSVYDVFMILVIIVIYTNAPKLKPFREKYNFRVFWDRLVRPKKDPGAETSREFTCRRRL